MKKRAENDTILVYPGVYSTPLYELEDPDGHTLKEMCDWSDDQYTILTSDKSHFHVPCQRAVRLSLSIPEHIRKLLNNLV